MRLKLVTGPAHEPVSLDEAKLHLRIDSSDENTIISALITAAREYIEHACRRALITQTWRLSLDDWPVTGDEIELPRAPLVSVTSVVYTDSDGTATTWAAANYEVDTDSQPGRIKLAYGESWPSATLKASNPIQITYIAGYGNAVDVPQHLRQAIMLLVGHWYENREMAAPVQLREVPLAVESLIWVDRVW